MKEEEKEKWDHITRKVESENLPPGDTLALVDEIIGEPDFKDLVEQMHCACGKQKPVSDFKVVSSGIAEVVYNVCASCEKDLGELAHLCCLGCKSTVGHMYPHKANTGFEFKKGRFYHIQECGFCTKNKNKKGKADVLEHVVFCKKNNIPTKSDPEFE